MQVKLQKRKSGRGLKTDLYTVHKCQLFKFRLDFLMGLSAIGSLINACRLGLFLEKVKEQCGGPLKLELL